MAEINVQMSLSSETAYEKAYVAVAATGKRPFRGKGRMAYPIVLVVRRVESEDEKRRIESVIRSVDPHASPAEPPGSFAR